jgi:hypothetical protein
MIRANEFHIGNPVDPSISSSPAESLIYRQAQTGTDRLGAREIPLVISRD